MSIVVRANDAVECPKCKRIIEPEDADVIDIDGECGALRLFSVTIKCKCGQIIIVEPELLEL